MAVVTLGQLVTAAQRLGLDVDSLPIVIYASQLASNTLMTHAIKSLCISDLHAVPKIGLYVG